MEMVLVEGKKSFERSEQPNKSHEVKENDCPLNAVKNQENNFRRCFERCGSFCESVWVRNIDAALSSDEKKHYDC